MQSPISVEKLSEAYGSEKQGCGHGRYYLAHYAAFEERHDSDGSDDIERPYRNRRPRCDQLETQAGREKIVSVTIRSVIVSGRRTSDSSLKPYTVRRSKTDDRRSRYENGKDDFTVVKGLRLTIHGMTDLVAAGIVSFNEGPK